MLFLKNRGRDAKQKPHAQGTRFVGLGVPKAGTTWLNNYFASRPDVWVPPVKELHYFDIPKMDDERYDFFYADRFKRLATYVSKISTMEKFTSKHHDHLDWLRKFCLVDRHKENDDWYRALFPKDGPYAAVGEVTPSYCVAAPATLAGMADIFPGIKAIVILREPASRIVSHMRFQIDKGRFTADSINKDVEAAVDLAMSEEYLQYSTYSKFLPDIERAFGAENIHYMMFEQLFSTPAEGLRLLSGLTEFLGFKTGETDEKYFTRKQNVSTEYEFTNILKDILYDKFGEEREYVYDKFGYKPPRWDR